MPIPQINFYPLANINQLLEEELIAASNKVIKSGSYILGQEVKNFEDEFAKFCGAKFAIGISNGLDALYIALKGYETLGFLKQGDHVIVPSNTYIASVLAITKAGLTPIMVEPNLQTYNLDAAAIKDKITNKSKIIMPVHLYGQTCQMDEIRKVAEDYNLKILEDGAQAQGATFNGKMVGNLGDCAGISLFPSKNLGALGDAGIFTTNDEELANVVRTFRNYGSKVKYHNIYQGENMRLDEMQAAFLRVKLKYLNDWNKKRVAVANQYLANIKNPNIILPKIIAKCNSVWHQFVIRSNHRDKLQQHLKANGIETLIHYPIAIHKQECFKDWNELNFPNAELIANTCLSLPIHNLLTEKEVSHITNTLNNFN